MAAHTFPLPLPLPPTSLIGKSAPLLCPAPPPPPPLPAALFSWGTGRVITKEQAMTCARRLPGRSWEAVDEALLSLRKAGQHIKLHALHACLLASHLTPPFPPINLPTGRTANLVLCCKDPRKHTQRSALNSLPATATLSACYRHLISLPATATWQNFSGKACVCVA